MRVYVSVLRLDDGPSKSDKASTDRSQGTWASKVVLAECSVMADLATCIWSS